MSARATAAVLLAGLRPDPARWGTLLWVRRGHARDRRVLHRHGGRLARCGPPGTTATAPVRPPVRRLPGGPDREDARARRFPRYRRIARLDATAPGCARGARPGRLGHCWARARAATRAEQHPESRGVQGKHPNAPGRTRTSDPLLRRQPLCPLSYGGAGPRIGARVRSQRPEPPPRDEPEKKKNHASKATAARITQTTTICSGPPTLAFAACSGRSPRMLRSQGA